MEYLISRTIATVLHEEKRNLKDDGEVRPESLENCVRRTAQVYNFTLRLSAYYFKQTFNEK